jgi:hypothetical protein
VANAGADGVSLREKYERRERTLYALTWPDGRAYIGQTLHPHTREMQHRRHWRAAFKFHPLTTMIGTQAEAEEHEYAWRWVAHRAGWRVVAEPRDGSPFVIRDPSRRMTPHRYALAARIRWPNRIRSPRRSLLARWFGWHRAA